MKREDIHSILIIGSGPIIIGQACEFDYSGTQACKALRQLGYRIILVNSNPATIMTDPEMADVTYIEPLNVERLTEIIEKERPDALLPNLGGQSGLNLSSELAKAGVLDGRRANGSAALGGYISQIASQYGASAALATSSNGGLITRRWFNPNGLARVAFMPGLVCIIMTTVGMIVSATSIARERELGSFEQLVVSPLTPVEIVIGKAATAVALATISACVILLLVVFGFKTPLQGPLWLFILSTILYLTAIICVGLFISSVSTTQQQATLGLFLFMPPAIMLSGFATPVENMPDWLQFLTLPNPLRWQLIVLKGLLTHGASARSIGVCLAPLAGVALVTFICAVFMFKRRME